MKKLLAIALSALLIISLVGLFGCTENSVTIEGDYVVITVDIKNVQEGATLKDYMEYLKEEAELEFTMENGMVSAMCGVSGEANEYWMLYTDDEENSNSAWGSCVYKEKTYNSASLGAESLKVKDGAVYIWYLQSFSL